MKSKGLRKGLSIKFHIFSTMLALTFIMLGIIWAFQGFFMDSVFKLTKESDVKRSSSLIAENINNSEVATLIEKVCVEYDVCASVLNWDTGVTLYDSHFLNDCILHKISDYDSLLRDWYDEASANEGEYTVVLSRDNFRDFNYDSSAYTGDVPEHDESESCVFSIRTIRDESSEYMIIINAAIEPMHATTRAIRILLLFVSLIFCVISVIISYILSKRLSSPIERITKSAKELQGGDYKVRFEESGPIEIRELAKTLNTTNVELDNADRLQKELIANISHDLRTPLTMISGYSEFMRDFPSEVSPENMQVIIDETARLNSLVNDLLDVSKLQSGAQTINMKRISLTKTILDTVKRYEKLTSHDNYEITFDYKEEVFVQADETRLLQVVYNLINNAINYTGEDKRIFIRQDVLDDVVRISIIDTGEGISEENLPLVWDRYYKIDKVHKRAVLGTGLGLSIVKNILLLHHSRFGVSSEIGKGSTFWFELKIIDRVSIIQ
ncbi:MAG: HAMP domain-containing histidine kinase [Ruminococcaceae bacterium]|nr:HAMP domain-containing histidine kinase [Oscillospiraceae bacterium]